MRNEYRILTGTHSRSKDEREELEGDINDLVSKGWEIYQIGFDSNGYSNEIFMRRPTQ